MVGEKQAKQQRAERCAPGRRGRAARHGLEFPELIGPVPVFRTPSKEIVAKTKQTFEVYT